MDAEFGAHPSADDTNQSLVMNLNGLIHMCYESHNGYMQAADGITSSAYKTMFAEYAHQRSRFASQLANLVVEHGGDPDDDGHAMKLFSGGWLGIQPAIMGGDYSAIFTECENSEAAAINAYRRVLEKQIPKHVAHVIKQQYEDIVEALDHIRSLRVAYELAHKN